MLNEDGKNKYPYSFLILYGTIYMSLAIYSTFAPIYLDSIGFNKSAIGVLLALGTLVSIVAQPIWGIASDRSYSKNTILRVLLLGSAVSIIFFPLSKSFIFLVIIISVFTLFQSSINPVSDSITLEYLDKRQWKFGPIRMAGTLGYAIMSVIAGVLARQKIEIIFFLYFCVAIIAFFTVFRLPLIQGHQSKGTRVPIWRIFESRELVILLAFHFIIQITFGFYYSFFSIHYIQLGADSGLLGWSMLISSASEIPFLLFADRILKKLGIRLTLIISALIISIRWVLIYFVTNIYAILFVNATHGLSFIVFAFCMATFISKNVPKELRASGQTMNALLCIGLARMLGSTIGGIISDITGIKQVFLYTSLIGFTAVIIFGSIFMIHHKNLRKEQRNLP